ncbi:MAG: TIGR00725 family protein [Thaumarchaeota archaeon]|nr:TIGR00725 family protein [Nitrososphaerota archaeon]
MGRRVQISVVGNNSDSCTQVAYDAAYRVGRAIAAQGGVVVCGGLGGVMEAASKGARDAGGLCIGIIPSADSSQANKYCDFVIATGLGKSRNFLVAYSADAVVVVGGGAGTLIEAAAAYQASKPVVAVKGTGGVADAWAGKYLDDRRTKRIMEASTPEDAVKMAMSSTGQEGGKSRKRKSELVSKP